jgi:hypothetical protein
MSVPQLRKLVLNYCDAVQALFAFNYQFTPRISQVLEEVRSETPYAYAKQLRTHRDELKEEIAVAATKFGLKDDPLKFAKWFKENTVQSKGILQLPKAFIDAWWFSNFTGDPERWREFPPHAQIMLDFSGTYYKPGQIEFYLPEAVFYEDMALGYNAAAKSGAAYTRFDPREKKKVKTRHLFVRTSVLSAFYFVEAYLNGIGFDYFVRHGDKLNADVKDKLLEWDSVKKRERWLNIRDKFLQYPKIILGLADPPIREDNSKNLKFFLGEARELRDGLVHQSPKGLVRADVSKVTAMVGLRFDDATRVVDTAIALVQEVNTILGQNGMNLGWLVPRKNEVFPDEAFL